MNDVRLSACHCKLRVYLGTTDTELTQKQEELEGETVVESGWHTGGCVTQSYANERVNVCIYMCR